MMKTYKLGEITKIKTGKLDVNAKVEGGKYPFFTCSKEISWIDTPSYDSECVLVAGNGDLNVKYYKGKFDAYQRTYIIESKGEQDLDMKYLYYFIEGYMETLRGQTIGGVIQYIKMNNLTDIQIPLPPLTTQHTIAERLDQIQELIDLKKQALTKTDELAKAIFLEMFGDPMTNEKGWEVNSLGNLCKFIDYRGKTPKKTDSGIPLITAKNIKKGYISESPEEYIAESDYLSWMTRGIPVKGSVAFTTEAPLGNAGQLNYDNKFALAQRVITFAPYKTSELNNEYLLYAVLTDAFQLKLKLNQSGSTVSGIRASELKKLTIPLPPLLLQQEFADIITEIESQKTEHTQALAKLEELYQAEMQRSFSV